MGGLRFRSWGLPVLVALTVAGALVVGVSGAAAAASVGYDISYPQCNGVFPGGGAFAVVGVNGGLPFSANPCLGSGDGASELAWAGMDAGLYANTADPGPALSSHWPNGQSAPRPCNTAANPGSNTAECHYDYGWNAAADSYRDAVNAYVSLGWASAGATRTPVANQWWLDVESANSWTSTPALNVQALQGEADYLASVGAAGVGFYSSSGDWQSITGSTAAFSAFPSWVAGAVSLSDAQSRCATSGFTTGPVALSQFVSGGFDNDYRCTVQPALQFSSSSQTFQAGTASGPITLQLGQPAATDLNVTVSSSSTAGQFASSPNGTWNSTISLPVTAGSTSTASFYYRDTKAGTPTLTASAPGYNSGAQTETITAGGLATITITPNSIQTKVGANVALQASGADPYGNPVPVSPTWTVAPQLGTFTPASGGKTSFTATAAGTAMITATTGTTTASVPLAVARKHH